MRQPVIVVLQVLCPVTACMLESCVQTFDIINNSSLVIYLYGFLGQASSKV